MGAQRRRRSRPAPLEHSRQRLRRRRHRFHRRHARHPRPRRPEPGRLRLSGRRRRTPNSGRSASCGRAIMSASAPSHSQRRRAWRRRSMQPSPRSPATSRSCPRYDLREPPILRRTPWLDVPRRWRPLPAHRVRRQRARSQPALPRPRARSRAARDSACAAFSTSRPASARSRFTTTPPSSAAQRCSKRSTSAKRASRRSNDIEVPSRIVHLPLSWDDPATQLAIRKYMQSVRPDAPWCPSNIEFIRRINGLESDRRRAPHRLRRQLSGARPGRCLPRRAGRHAPRPAPSPGHHQVQSGAHLDARERRRHRRRLPVRLRHGRPRRLPVRRPHGADVEHLALDARVRTRQAVAAALLRSDPLLSGKRGGAARDPRIVPVWRISAEHRASTFRLREYRAFLDSIEAQAADFKRRQQAAFDAERERWAAADADQARIETEAPDEPPPTDSIPEGCQPFFRPSRPASGTSPCKAASASRPDRGSSYWRP